MKSAAIKLVAELLQQPNRSVTNQDADLASRLRVLEKEITQVAGTEANPIADEPVRTVPALLTEPIQIMEFHEGCLEARRAGLQDKQLPQALDDGGPMAGRGQLSRHRPEPGSQGMPNLGFRVVPGQSRQKRRADASFPELCQDIVRHYPSRPAPRARKGRDRVPETESTSGPVRLGHHGCVQRAHDEPSGPLLGPELAGTDDAGTEAVRTGSLRQPLENGGDDVGVGTAKDGGGLHSAE